MFTGIVEEVGRLLAREARGPGARLTLACTFPRLQLGESICVSGVCLTVTEIGQARFSADASAETLALSTLSALRAGGSVNLERALTPESRLGGHYVAGHADGIGELLEVRPLGDASAWRFSLPADLARFVAKKGSIAIDGVSLTVNDVDDRSFSLVVIPHTLARTTLVDRKPGDRVTLEVDLLARYVVRHLEVTTRAAAGASESDNLEDHPIHRKLRDGGYL